MQALTETVSTRLTEMDKTVSTIQNKLMIDELIREATAKEKEKAKNIDAKNIDAKNIDAHSSPCFEETILRENSQIKEI